MAPKFRFAGLRPPSYAPKVSVVRTPLWEPNRFTRYPLTDPENGPIYSVSGDPPAGGTPATLSSPGVTQRCFHWRNPGGMYLTQASDASMAWAIDKYFAFKCYFQLDSVAGRVPLFYRRSSLRNGGPFVEVRDGHLVAGWYDTELKKEVWVQTSKAVIDPGYVYYLYCRKIFPRGGIAGSLTNSLYTPLLSSGDYGGSNWTNSIHTGALPVGGDFCYDALIWRRFPRVAPSAFSYTDWTGYDAKPFKLPAYDYHANSSSVRACVSAPIADSFFSPSYPYELDGAHGPDGCVMFERALDQVATTGDVVALSTAASNMRFLLDHVGMLLQISDDQGSAVNGETYRIVEFIDATRVRVLNRDGTIPSFTFAAGVQKISVFMGVSLVKSPDYDVSKSPDTADYAIEAFGSSLSANPFNGVAAFNGRVWSFAWGIFAGTTNDGDGHPTGLPSIFEDGALAMGAGNRITSACEIGTDLFGLQGSTNPLDGTYPCDGTPAGELEVDNNFARVAVDTTPYYATAWGAVVASATAPASTQPNSGLAATLDATCTSVVDPNWANAREVLAGRRVARVSFYDPDNDEESAPGEQLIVEVQEEDLNNPSSDVRLVFENLPATADMDRNVARRIRISPNNATTLFVAKDIYDAETWSAEVQIDDISMQRVGGPAIDDAAIAERFGVPPRGNYIAFSQARLAIGNLEDQPDGVAFSLPEYPSVFPASNVFPVDTGEAGVTGLAELSGALVVFKRNAVMPYVFADGLPVLQRSVRGDGCASHASIVSLEDRLYYMSDRGPMVLLSDWSPFFLGWRVSGTMRQVDVSALRLSHGGINRARGQYHVTLQRKGDTRQSQRLAIEFVHPTTGEDTTRAELISGHRFGLYEDPSCVSLATVQDRNGGAPLFVAGTEEGFVAWMDREDTLLCMLGPSASIWNEGDLRLEGASGVRAHVPSGGRQVILFNTITGIYAGKPTAYIQPLRSGTMVSYWSTKEIDVDAPELEKRGVFLDVARRVSSGKLAVQLFSNYEGQPRGTVYLDLGVPFESIELGEHLQESRSFRLVFLSDGIVVYDVDFEILDILLRTQYVDSR